MKFNLSQKNLKLILKFEFFSIFLSIVGIIILYINLKLKLGVHFLEAGLKIFRASLFSGVSSFCIGVFFNGVQKDLIK